MKKISFAIISILGLVASTATAQQSNFSVHQKGTITPGDGVSWAAPNTIQDSGGTPGGVTWPTSGDIVQSNGTNTPNGLGLGCGLSAVGGVLNPAQCPGRAGIATTDTITSADNGAIVSYSAASSVTICAASSTGCTQGFGVEVDNVPSSTGNVTLTPVSGTIAGKSSVTVFPGEGCYFYSDSTNLQVTYASCMPLLNLISTTSSANAIAVGQNGATNPALQVDASTASSATGLSVKSAASGGGVLVKTVSSASNEALTLSSKGSGQVKIGSLDAGSGSIELLVGGTSPLNVTSSGAGWTATVAASGNASAGHYSFVGPNDSATGLTASTEANEMTFNFNQTRQHATGTIALQRETIFAGSTHTFVGASTITELADVALSAYAQGGTNATITNGDGLYIPTVAATGTVTASAAHFVAPTGGTTDNLSLLTSGEVQHASLGTVTAGTNGAACFSTDGHLGANAANCIVSLLKYKQELEPITPEDALSTISKLAADAISYRFTDDYLGKQKDQPHAKDRQVGFGAEWVEKDDPRLAEYDSNGKLAGVRYEQLTALEAVAIAELKRENFFLKIGVFVAISMSFIALFRARRACD